MCSVYIAGGIGKDVQRRYLVRPLYGKESYFCTAFFQKRPAKVSDLQIVTTPSMEDTYNVYTYWPVRAGAHTVYIHTNTMYTHTDTMYTHTDASNA